MSQGGAAETRAPRATENPADVRVGTKISARTESARAGSSPVQVGRKKWKHAIAAG